MKEDFVPFKIAELLKEKGFDEETRSCYYFNDTSKVYSNWGIGCNYNGYGFKNICVSAPTLQMACKWLREKYKLNIIISVDDLDWFYSIIDYTHKGDVKMLNDLAGFNSYESACEAAIEYCLTTLI